MSLTTRLRAFRVVASRPQSAPCTIDRYLQRRFDVRKWSLLPARAAMLFVAVAFAPCAAISQERFDRHDRERDRFRHEHYYPAPGFSVTVLPSGYMSVTFGTGRYFFHSGVWYQQAGPGYVVVRPPLGVVVPVLPPDYTVVSIAGVPYYYANDIYYAAGPGGYVVAQPPVTASPVPGQIPLPAPMSAPLSQSVPGYAVTELPPGNMAIMFSSQRYYYQAGVWYRRNGHRFVVVRPPAGIRVPVLPPSYATVSIAGVPYYYANNTYYAAGPGGYVVAEPPIAAVSTPPPSPPPGPAQQAWQTPQAAPAPTAQGAPPA